jgi:MFS family permease
VLGSTVLAAGMAVIGAGAWWESIVVVMLGFALQGLGHGLTRPPVSASLANSVDEANLGIAAASERMMFQVGSTLGITLLVIISAGSHEPGPFTAAFLVGAAIGLAAVAVVSLLRPSSITTPGEALAGTRHDIHPAQLDEVVTTQPLPLGAD